MKSLIAAAMLLALVSPAYATSDAEWDCPGGIRVSAGRNQIVASFTYGPDRNDPDSENPRRIQLIGNRHLNLKWDFRNHAEGPDLWLNGKACTG